MPDFSETQILELREAAIAAAAKAYSPYSKINVGSAILAHDGKIYTGCNVENASYGLTVCAERSAISAAMLAISENRQELIKAIYIWSNKSGAIPPCGACRQVIFEFGRGGVAFFPTEMDVKQLAIEALLPEAFYL